MNDKSTVSFYGNVFDKIGIPCEMQKILNAIQSGKWKPQIEKLRAIQDEKAQKAFKNTLPCYTPSGLFSERNAESLISHSGVLLLDFDAKDNPCLFTDFKEIRKRLIADQFTHFLFTSCRGNGIALAVRIDPGKHLENFLFLERYYRENFGLVVDKGCKDVCRLRYVSYDPELFINEKAEIVVVPVSVVVDRTVIHYSAENNRAVMEAIIASGKAIGDHAPGTRSGICHALCSAFPEAEARNYTHILMSRFDHYDPAITDKMFNTTANKTHRVNFSKIVALAQLAGINLNGKKTSTALPKVVSGEWNPVVEKVDVVDVSYSVKNNNILDETAEAVLPVIPFSMECFSERFKQTIEKISTSFFVDTDVCASIALSVASAAIGNTVRISPKSGWETALFIWMMIIADTGYGKTHPTNCLVKPIDRRQAKAYRKYKKLMTVYNSEMGMFRKDKNKELPEKPEPEQFKTSDYTIESLADVFENQPRGVLIHRDEMSGLVLGMNQYKGGKGNDRQHMLELFNGDSWKIDRKSGSRFIPNTGAGIIGGLQPQIMPKIFGQDSFYDGLLPRFLFVSGSNKKQRFNRVGITNDDLAFWYDLIEYCYEIPLKINPEGYVGPLLLIFSDDALNLWEKFFNEFHTIEAFLPNRVRVFIPKLITYSLKLAGILHVLKGFKTGNSGTVISADTINDAIGLTRFYAGQVTKIVKQYNKPEAEINEYETIVIQALMDLECEVKNLKLPLGRIVEIVNRTLPEKLNFKDNENIGSILRKVGLQTKQSTGGFYYLVWEDEKVKNLYRRTSTTSTMSTNPEPFVDQF